MGRGARCIDSRQHHAELLAAVAPGDVVHAQRFAQDRGHRAQRVVADLVAVRVVHRLEVIDVEHQHRGRMADTPAALELGLHRPLPVHAVHEPRQAIESGERREHVVLLAHAAGEAIGGIADGDRIGEQQRQARHNSDEARVEVQREVVHQRDQRPGGDLRVQAAREEAHAADRRLVHRQHRDEHRARHEVEADRRHPGAAARGVEHQVVQLGAVRIAAAARDAIGEMRPGEAVQGKESPEPERRLRLPQAAADGERADAEAQHARHVHAAREAQPFFDRALERPQAVERFRAVHGTPSTILR